MRNLLPSAPTRRAVLLAALLLAPAARAEQAPAAPARCVSDETLLLRRKAPGQPWALVKERQELAAGELLVGGPGASMVSRNGAVRLSFLGELTGSSGYPVLETAVILHDSK